ncbi:M16 family metallopeptidase [Aliikangiella coralliicola]|uniref:Insulinase family protein n=1 Tax=Aliikangiella coralliicola TaxID=2592383 RepID=A0A545UFH2_9GAMM|nr:pitrilysin family protein [Aliikangiella coralliicola]TQV88217.1 insulinase family protein [Aliikangiella coralliicola]
MKKLLIPLALSGLLYGCQTESIKTTTTTATPKAELTIPFEKYQLDNGLTVILHQDKSDPIVAISTIVHAGSNREKPGRTGFAHFFEHMAFNDSENVPQGANRKMIEELGGVRNGGTWSDGTIYYEVVPKDALEKLMWIDSDRLGFMINTVNEGALEREKQVVKNEKRQRVDNQAYGHTGHVIRKNLYPENHPYNWTVIGDLEDLQAATLEDVKEFYAKYYGPANATLVIAGDIDISETKALVKRWFGEIKKSEPIADPKPMPVNLTTTKKLFHLDTFAKVPELRITFPTVEQYHQDSYALSALGEILSQGKRAALYKQIVETEKLAPNVAAYQNSNEMAGTFTIRVRAHAGKDLDDINNAVTKALTNFEKNSFSDNDLARIKARQETGFYNGISSVLNKAFQLGSYEEYAGDPGFISQDIENIKKVTREDVVRVYNQYIKGQNYIMTSFVPKEQASLIVDGSEKANVVEEKIVQGAEKNFDSDKVVEYQKTPTKHSREEPALSDAPLISVPKIHTSKADNGLEIYNIEHTELPLVNFNLRIDGGAWLESKDKLGTATLLAELMNEGTQQKTPEELEDAIGLLGAGIQFSAGADGIYINGNTLARNYNATMALVTEMLLTPRWDEKEFERIKARRLNTIKQQEARPFSVASRAFYSQVYGDQHRAGLPTSGTSETVSQLTLDDLKTFYNKNLSPKNSSLHVVGDIQQKQVLAGIQLLSKKWQGEKVRLPAFTPPKKIGKPVVYFVDIPSAKQSVIIAGKPALAGNHPDHYKFSVAQNRLGGGGSARLFQTLRIEKGYTYGAYSQMSKRHYTAPFLTYSQVRSNVTLESLQIFKDLIANYDETFTAKDLSTTKNLLIKKNTRNFETINNLINMLDEVSKFDLPHNYIENQQKELNALTLEEVRNLYQKYGEEQQMVYVVVGDAKTQLERVKQFGYGDPIMLDRKGQKL